MRIAAAAAHSCRNEKQLDENPTTAGFNSQAFTSGMPLPRGQAQGVLT